MARNEIRVAAQRLEQELQDWQPLSLPRQRRDRFCNVVNQVHEFVGGVAGLEISQIGQKRFQIVPSLRLGEPQGKKHAVFGRETFHPRAVFTPRRIGQIAGVEHVEDVQGVGKRNPADVGQSAFRTIESEIFAEKLTANGVVKCHGHFPQRQDFVPSRVSLSIQQSQNRNSRLLCVHGGRSSTMPDRVTVALGLNRSLASTLRSLSASRN